MGMLNRTNVTLVTSAWLVANVLLQQAAFAGSPSDASEAAPNPRQSMPAAPAAPPPTAPTDEHPALSPTPAATETTTSPTPQLPPSPVATEPPAEPPPDIVIGHGYHPFDHPYLLFGLSSQYPTGFEFPFYDVIEELEISFVPPVSNNLFWYGVLGNVGMRYRLKGQPGGAHAGTGARAGIGVEAGWRFIGADLSYVRDESQRAAIGKGDVAERDYKDALRLRVGVALAAELFSKAHFSRSCCVPKESTTVCECERTPLGGSLFIYWAHENYYLDGRYLSSGGDWQGMFGFSIKMAIGL